MPSTTFTFTALLGFFLLASPSLLVRAQDLGQQPCPFNETIGPNIVVANIVAPDGRSEINGWAYGFNWCSTSQRISGGKNICTGNGVEYLHVPLSDKFGDFDGYKCYNNFIATFENCVTSAATGDIDYPSARVHFKSTLDSSEFTYECKPTREMHACVYNGQLLPASEVSYTAFLSCGVTSTP